MLPSPKERQKIGFVLLSSSDEHRREGSDLQRAALLALVVALNVCAACAGVASFGGQVVRRHARRS